MAKRDQLLKRTRIDRVTILRRDRNEVQCRCSCGCVFSTSYEHLIHAKVASCGCWLKDLYVLRGGATIPGLTNFLYGKVKSLHTAVTNNCKPGRPVHGRHPQTPATLCPAWQTFEGFAAWAAPNWGHGDVFRLRSETNHYSPATAGFVSKRGLFPNKKASQAKHERFDASREANERWMKSVGILPLLSTPPTA